MRKTLTVVSLLVTLLLLGSSAVVSHARPLTAITISQQAPAACPGLGCAAGQRINMRASYPVNPQNTSTNNTQVCVYSSKEGGASWADNTVFSVTNTTIYTAGELSSTCSNNIPADRIWLGGAYASFSSVSNQDFDFAFRISKNSASPGSLQIAVHELNAAGDAWVLSDTQTTPLISTAAIANPSYVAADIASCGGYSPCYLNSGDDLAGGIGTGLKDAVDASSGTGTISILGSYPIKSNAVVLPNPQVLQGLNDATLTYGGTSCDNSLLLVTGGATIQNLNINDGICASPSRNLIEVNSSSDVHIQSNDLVSGKDALTVQNNSGNVFVQFNHINQNSGYAILRTAGSAAGTIKAIANNLYGNRVGYQIECNGKGEANHNFLGPGAYPASTISNCTFVNGKQLGAAALNKDAAPGVSAMNVVVSAIKTGYFSNHLFINGTAGTTLTLVDHGSGSYQNIPFFGTGTSNITACSNFFDVFLSDENSITPSWIDLYLPYSIECEGVIETSSFCDGSDPAAFPLLWYDPQNQVTEQWDSTGQTPAGPGASGMLGQTTSCNMATNEIVVELDSSIYQRPNLVSDLNFTPFAIGYPNQDILFLSFNAISGIAKADLYWETTRESGLKGYYVVRSTNPYGPYSRDSELILAKGDENIGGIYSYIDTGLENGTSYWYMLEMIDFSNDTIDFHGPVSATTYSMIPTATEVTPNSALVYGTSLSIKVKGNNFISNSIILWDSNLGIDLNTSYINNTELTAIIPASLLTSSALHQITVYNPGPGGGSSPPLTFTINNPVPVLNSISPDFSDGNITTLNIELTGDNFVSTSRVRFNGSDSNVTTTFVDRYHLTARILRSYLSSGSIQVTVYNPSYGGGTSAVKTFNMYTPTPTLTKVPTAYRSATPYYRSPTPIRTRTRTPTRTVTGTIFITPNTTNQLTPALTGSTSPGPGGTPAGTSGSMTATATLAPGEPTYTPDAFPPGTITGGGITGNWRIMTGLRILGGIVAGTALLMIPSILVLRTRFRFRKSRR